MKHYVYFIEDPVTKEFYIGVRSCKCEIKDDPYMGSMSTWKPDKSKLVKTIFDEYKTREEANKMELNLLQYYINKNDFPLNRNYHITDIGFCNLGKKCSTETKEKMSVAHMNMKPGMSGKKHSNETKEKMSVAHMNMKPGMKPGMSGKKHSNETKEKMRKIHTGKIITDETKEKMSVAKRNMSNETKEKMSVAKRNMSNETKEKMSVARKKRIISEETRRKISKALTGKKYKVVKKI